MGAERGPDQCADIRFDRFVGAVEDAVERSQVSGAGPSAARFRGVTSTPACTISTITASFTKSNALIAALHEQIGGELVRLLGVDEHWKSVGERQDR